MYCALDCYCVERQQWLGCTRPGEGRSPAEIENTQLVSVLTTTYVNGVVPLYRYSIDIVGSTILSTNIVLMCTVRFLSVKAALELSIKLL